ncbi:hypothetical protein [Longimicrobium sp.]|uniref:hypothetical protein n=1 Tax=Longimicrobium sp. TaxID=2029185 RepID=UPI002BA1CB0E|nr:hypothetical protein [Longimicrobium sp.]HSU15287.1 hypothetical protein [Longimicrobium sp.]
MSRSRIVCAATVAALALLAAPAARAQSGLSARGLGYPLEGLDARARGLGGLTTGLPDPHLSLINPASVVGIPAAGLSVTFQGDIVSSQSAGRDEDFSTSRFPAIQAAFPITGRLVATVGYAAVLDQNWAVSRLDSIQLGGQKRLVTDVFRSEGGAARLRLGGGYRVLPRVDVGAGLDIYTGALRDSTLRTISGLPNIALQGTDYTWQGLGYSAGARWRGNAVSVSAAVTGGGQLKAEPADSGVTGGTYSLPVTFDVGASARVTQRTLAALSVRFGQWSSMNDELLSDGGSGGGAGYGGGAQDALQVAGGLEYEGIRFLGRPIPLRVGGRYAKLPFRYSADSEFPEERAVTGGLGVLFGGGAAALELSGERGMRGGDAAGLEESFWRVSFSLALLGR